MGRISDSDLVDSGQAAIVGRENTGLDDLNTLYSTLPNDDVKFYGFVARGFEDQAIAKLQELKDSYLPNNPAIDETDEYTGYVNSGNPFFPFSGAIKNSQVQVLKDWVLTTRDEKEVEFRNLENALKTKVLTLADATGFTVGNTINQTTGDSASGEIKAISGNDVTVFTQTELVFAVGETVQEGANNSTINSIE